MRPITALSGGFVKSCFCHGSNLGFAYRDQGVGDQNNNETVTKDKGWGRRERGFEESQKTQKGNAEVEGG